MTPVSFRYSWALLLGTFAFIVPPVSAQTPPKAEPAPLVTKVYDLKPLFKNKDANLPSNLDAVVRLILDIVPFGELKVDPTGPRILERDGDSLEVRASAKVQAEVADLIAALLRLADLAVDLKAELLEIDSATFEKDVRPLFKPAKGKADPPAAIAFGISTDGREDVLPPPLTLQKIMKEGRIRQSSERRYPLGLQTAAIARQTLFRRQTLDGKPGSAEISKEGFRLLVVPTVSADRRFVRLKLTEQSAEIAAKRKCEDDAGTGKLIVIETMTVEDSGKIGSIVVADGGCALFRLGYAPKDKVWLVVLRPTIYIQAEQDELKKQGKK